MKDRRVLLVAVVAGILAAAAWPVWIYAFDLRIVTMRDGVVSGAILMPFAICMGSGYVVYGILRLIHRY